MKKIIAILIACIFTSAVAFAEPITVKVINSITQTNVWVVSKRKPTNPQNFVFTNSGLEQKPTSWINGVTTFDLDKSKIGKQLFVGLAVDFDNSLETGYFHCGDRNGNKINLFNYVSEAKSITIEVKELLSFFPDQKLYCEIIDIKR